MCESCETWYGNMWIYMVILGGAEILKTYIYWCFECDNGWKWFHEGENVGIDSIEKRKMCMYMCSIMAENAMYIYVDVFKLETHGNEPRNIKMLISIKL